MSKRPHRDQVPDGPVHRLFAGGGDPDDGPVLAAGALCWRTGEGGRLELLLVRSARWGDWSWPKGKLDRGESLPECAVREVAEETGARIELGPPLPGIDYVLPDGRDKSVRYWAARVRGTGRPTAGDDEIAETAWLPVDAVRERLERPGDPAPLEALLELADEGRLDTRPLLVLRHAKARRRSHWDGSEADRPLTGTGRRQAAGLAGLLACWAPERVLTSPWARCTQTLEPFLARPDAEHPRGREPEVVPLLSEDGLRHDPGRIDAALHDLLAHGRPALLCTHRPVLEAVVRALVPVTVPDVRDELPDDDPWLSPAEVLVAHVAQNQRPGVTEVIRSVERYRGESV